MCEHVLFIFFIFQLLISHSLIPLKNYNAVGQEASYQSVEVEYP